MDFPTPAHIMEPAYPAAVERYVDLGRFYDVRAMKEQRAEVMAAADAYRRAYRQAFRCLSAAQQVREEGAALLDLGEAARKALRRAEGVARREFSGRGALPGRLRLRLLGGPTCKGWQFCFDTVEQLCPRVYVLADSFGIGAAALEHLKQAALAAGHDVIACPDPAHPTRWQHLLVPSAGVAFLTVEPSLALPLTPYRRLRLDAMIDAAQLRHQRARLRFARRIAGELENEAVAQLRAAKGYHDDLEALYNPHVDFEGVYALAEAEAWRILEG